MLPYGLAALVYGPLARNVEGKKILLYCLGGLSLANIAAGLAPNTLLLFSARILAGLSGAGIIPLSLILIAKTSAPHQRGRRVGGFFSITFVSSLLGLFLSGLVCWRWIFLLPAIGAALVCLGICLWPPDFSFRREKLKFNYLRAFSDKRVFRLFVYIFAISFLYHGVRQWLGVYFFTVYGLEQFLISALLTTISLSGILGESLGGILSDRVGRRRIINVGAGLMLASLVALLFKNVTFSLFAIMFVWGLGWTFNHAAISTFLTDLPQEHLYESASLNSSVRFLSGGLGALLGGILARRSFNLEFMFFAFCLFVLFIVGKKLILERSLNGNPAR